MTTLREAAEMALKALIEYEEHEEQEYGFHRKMAEIDALGGTPPAIVALRAALAEPVQEPGDFDHGIGADRFKVVRGAFWWHVLIGDSPTEHGKFHSRASAEKMAADLLREFRNGAFVQHETALAEPVQEQDIEDAIEAAYWQFDCRRSGLNEWASAPQSERDAFKAEARKLVKGYFPTRQAQDTKREMLAVADAFIRGKRAALAEPCQCGDRPAAQCPGKWEPGCDLGNNPKYAKRVEMTPKELAASIKRGEKWKVAEPGSLMIAAQQFLEWNRAQSPPPVTVGFELGVFEAVKKLYPFPPQRPAEPVQEPVAWRYVPSDVWGDPIVTQDPRTVELARQYGRPIDPLYTTTPQRKPLTDEEIDSIWDSEKAFADIYAIARAIERAHGIGGQP